MTPSPEEGPHPPLLEGRTAAVSTVLAAAVGMMMLWVWTEHMAFAVAALCAVATLLAMGLLFARSGGTELVGGPLDGARVQQARAERCRDRGLVLVVNGGVRVRYSFDESGRLVYRGRTDGNR